MKTDTALYYVGEVRGGYAVFMIDTEGCTSQVGKVRKQRRAAVADCNELRAKERAAAEKGSTP